MIWIFWALILWIPCFWIDIYLNVGLVIIFTCRQPLIIFSFLVFAFKILCLLIYIYIYICITFMSNLETYPLWVIKFIKKLNHNSIQFTIVNFIGTIKNHILSLLFLSFSAWVFWLICDLFYVLSYLCYWFKGK